MNKLLIAFFIVATFAFVACDDPNSSKKENEEPVLTGSSGGSSSSGNGTEFGGSRTCACDI